MKTMTGMTMQRGTVVVMQPKPAQAAATREVREATTGRVIAMLPKVWAVAEAATQDAPQRPEPPVELAFYRKYTEGMLRRYVRLSMETGRVPSLLGREMFRGQVTSYRVHSFEDVVIFCLDMERLLHRLTDTEKRLVKRIGLQQYSQGETAVMLGLSLRDCVRRYAKSLDHLTEMLLQAGMLEPQMDVKKPVKRAEAGDGLQVEQSMGVSGQKILA